MNTIHLHDASSGARARILGDLGFNCYSFTVPNISEPLEVLWATPGFEHGTERPSSSGVPILFPFPGRIRGTQFAWNDQIYQLDEGDNRGNAIHGFVHTRAWRIIESSAVRVVGQFQASLDDPSILESWPADFRITATYELDGTALRSSFLIENPDDRPLPFGLGTHPYIRVPLGGPSRDDCRVQVPVATCWQLEDMIPTGQSLPSDDARQLSTGMPFRQMQFDSVFGGLEFVGQDCTSRVADPAGRTLTLTFNDIFQACVVYNPSHREAVCVEPYTCVPDPFRLTRDGHDVGLRVLEPGTSLAAYVEMRID